MGACKFQLQKSNRPPPRHHFVGIFHTLPRLITQRYTLASHCGPSRSCYPCAAQNSKPIHPSSCWIPSQAACYIGPEIPLVMFLQWDGFPCFPSTPQWTKISWIKFDNYLCVRNARILAIAKMRKATWAQLHPRPQWIYHTYMKWHNAYPHVSKQMKQNKHVTKRSLINLGPNCMQDARTHLAHWHPWLCACTWCLGQQLASLHLQQLPLIMQRLQT